MVLRNWVRKHNGEEMKTSSAMCIIDTWVASVLTREIRCEGYYGCNIHCLSCCKGDNIEIEIEPSRAGAVGGIWGVFCIRVHELWFMVINLQIAE